MHILYDINFPCQEGGRGGQLGEGDIVRLIRKDFR